jgi:hypothetical protein
VASALSAALRDPDLPSFLYGQTYLAITGLEEGLPILRRSVEHRSSGFTTTNPNESS